MKYISDVPNDKWENTPVLVRVDVNEPIDEDGLPQNTFRIERTLPTLRYLSERGTKLILLAHLGKPDGEHVSRLRLRYIVKEIEHQLRQEIHYVPEVTGDQVQRKAKELEAGEVMMLENVRFDKREIKNSDALADEWAKLAKRYVNNAFATSHREHTSLAAITQFLPSYGGLLLKDEIQTIDRLLEDPPSPSVAVIGGAKIDTKLPVINIFAERFDYVLVGGLVGNEFLDRYGKDYKSNIYLPQDFADADRSDIGPETIQKFQHILASASCIFWNGPMGKIEEDPYDTGTRSIMRTIMEHNENCFSVAGGGETAYSISQWGNTEQFDFISTGGGALLRYIQHGTLPAIEYLQGLKSS